MKTLIAATATLLLTGFGMGMATAAPVSVPREDGPCYPGYESDSPDGTLSCSGEDGIWVRKSLSKAPRFSVGTPCATLGARARARENHGVIECQRTENGLRWQNIR